VDVGHRTDPEQRGQYIAQLAGYLTNLAAQRRENPTDDLLGALVIASDQGDRLTEDEVVQLTLVILAAGYESTASQIVNFTYALLTHPDQLAVLRSRPDLMPGAVEELMRWVPLLAVADVPPRYALADVELSGGTVRAGEPVLLAKHAANRDPRRYDDPDRLDITHDAQGQLGFGHGAHHCLGALLARMDIQTALTALLQRFPDLRLTVPEADLQLEDRHGGTRTRCSPDRLVTNDERALEGHRQPGRLPQVGSVRGHGAAPLPARRRQVPSAPGGRRTRRHRPRCRRHLPGRGHHRLQRRRPPHRPRHA
jgi:cytochrome P450